MSIQHTDALMPPYVDLEEKQKTFKIFSRGALIFAVHVLVILGLLGLFTL